jgi:hypothetical protein
MERMMEGTNGDMGMPSAPGMGDGAGTERPRRKRAAKRAPAKRKARGKKTSARGKKTSARGKKTSARGKGRTRSSARRSKAGSKKKTRRR